MAKRENLRLMVLAVLVVLIVVLAGQSNAAINIALNTPASTNKNIWSDYWPSKAVDGDNETQWGADHHGNPVDPTWLKIDLEEVFTVEQIVLKVRTWQTQYAGYYIDYILYGSSDGQLWEEVGQGRLIDFDDPIDTIGLNGKSMRYLRCDVVGGTHWAHLHEIEVYAEPTRLEIRGPREVAEDFQAQYKAIAYFDNNSTTDITALADWSVEPNTAANIDENGVLTTKDVVKHRSATILASYSERDVTFEAEKAIDIFTICPTGTALSFDGVDDYVEVADNPSLDNTDEITVEAWVKRMPNELIVVAAKRLLANNSGYSCIVEPDGSFGGTVFEQFDHRSTTTIPVDMFNHVAWTYDKNAGVSCLYINGILDNIFFST
ncbi:MAG: discoidin domain-containing protein, partial [Planctomycetota bacterium]